MSQKKYTFKFNLKYGTQLSNVVIELTKINLLECLKKLNEMYFRSTILKCELLHERKYLEIEYIKNVRLSDSDGFREKEIKQLIYKNSVNENNKRINGKRNN